MIGNTIDSIMFSNKKIICEDSELWDSDYCRYLMTKVVDFMTDNDTEIMGGMYLSGSKLSFSPNKENSNLIKNLNKRCLMDIIEKRFANDEDTKNKWKLFYILE